MKIELANHRRIKCTGSWPLQPDAATLTAGATSDMRRSDSARHLRRILLGGDYHDVIIVVRTFAHGAVDRRIDPS